MGFRMNETTDAPKISEAENTEMSMEAKENFDSLMGDDDLPDDPSYCEQADIEASEYDEFGFRPLTEEEKQELRENTNWPDKAEGIEGCKINEEGVIKYPCRNEGMAWKENPITGVKYERRIVEIDGYKVEVVQDMAEKARELKEFAPSFLKEVKIPEKGIVDINEPVSRKNCEGFTEYQKELLSEEYGLSKEEISRYSDWDEFEEKVLERKVPNGTDNLESITKGGSETGGNSSFPIDPRISDKETINNESIDELSSNKAKDSSEQTNQSSGEKNDLSDSNTEKELKDDSLDTDQNENQNSDTRCPTDHGRWEGERGNSKWIPDGEYVPPEKGKPDSKPYSNPDKLRWKDILAKYGIDGIPFKDGYPDFSDISRGTVKIEGFESGGNDAKNRNFRKADIELAKQRGCTPQDVAKWRKENNYTWHECENKTTMMKVPNEVHANVPHDGGRSQKE